MNERHEQRETTLETALNEYPLATLPPSFVSRVMARIAHVPQWRPEPFRVSWRDLLLSGITAVFIYLLLSLNLWLLGRDVSWLPATSALFSFNLDALTTIGWLSIAAMILMGEIGLLLLLGVGLWWDRPFMNIPDR